MSQEVNEKAHANNLCSTMSFLKSKNPIAFWIYCRVYILSHFLREASTMFGVALHSIHKLKKELKLKKQLLMT